MLDILQIIFWSITYILIICVHFLEGKNKKSAIPLIACILNFGWEITSFIKYPNNVGNVIWLSLDILIFIYCIYTIDVTNKIFYLFILTLLVITLLFIFNLDNGTLISCFVIDLLMAIIFVVDFDLLSNKFKPFIAITKLFGDLFAFQYYKYNEIVMIIGLIVLCINLYYLYKCTSTYNENYINLLKS